MESAVEDVQGSLSRYVEKKTKKRNRRKRKNTKGTRLTLLHGVRYAVPTSGFERAILMFEVSNALSVLDCATTLVADFG